MATETAIRDRVRKSKFRHATIVMAAIDERILMIGQTDDIVSVKSHVARIEELLDELKRGMNGKEETE